MEYNNQMTTTILSAEDDEDHLFLLKHALKYVNSNINFQHVWDGQELMDYLLRKGKYAFAHSAPAPDFILLDLNMPKKNGWEALKEIRSNPELCQIPIVVFTVSNDQEDIRNSYSLGANLFITKPTDFQELVDVMSGCLKSFGAIRKLRE